VNQTPKPGTEIPLNDPRQQGPHHGGGVATNPGRKHPHNRVIPHPCSLLPTSSDSVTGHSERTHQRPHSQICLKAKTAGDIPRPGEEKKSQLTVGARDFFTEHISKERPLEKGTSQEEIMSLTVLIKAGGEVDYVRRTLVVADRVSQADGTSGDRKTPLGRST